MTCPDYDSGEPKPATTKPFSWKEKKPSIYWEERVNLKLREEKEGENEEGEDEEEGEEEKKQANQSVNH